MEEYQSNSLAYSSFLYNDLQRWWGGSTKQKKQIEIDMMSTQNDNALFGECKWTNNKVDISVDIIRIVTLPLLAKWGVTEGCSLQIKKRGAEPLVFFILL